MDITSLPALDLPLTHRRGDELYLINPRTTGNQVFLPDGGTVAQALEAKDFVALFEAALGGKSATTQTQE